MMMRRTIQASEEEQRGGDIGRKGQQISMWRSFQVEGRYLRWKHTFKTLEDAWNTITDVIAKANKSFKAIRIEFLRSGLLNAGAIM